MAQNIKSRARSWLRWPAMALTLTVSLALGACGGSGTGKAEADAAGVRTISVGVIPSMTVAPLYLGMEKGFFEEVKLRAEPVQGAGGAALLPALLNNQTQIAYSNVVSLMLAQEQGLPVKVVANGAHTVEPGKPVPEHNNEALVVAEDSGIRSARDLAGKTVAINTLKNVSEVLAKHAIDQSGGDSSQVKFIEMPTSEMLSALDAGHIDAAEVVEPVTTMALDQGFEVLLEPFVSLDDPASDISVWFTSQRLMEQDPQLISDFQEAMNKSLDSARENPEEAREMVKTYTDVPPELLDRVSLPYWAPDLNVESIEEIGDLSVKYGVLSKDPDLEDLLSDAPTP